MLNAEITRGWVEDVTQKWQQISPYKVESDKLKHLAIICDGNRRAALSLGLEPPFLGHLAGVEVIKGIAKAARAWEIPFLTFWTWSTDNWRRDQKQTNFVMELARQHLSQKDFLKELLENEARFTHLGRKDQLPPVLQRTLNKLEESTKHLNHFRLNLAMDYGGIDEILRAIAKMQKDDTKDPQPIWKYLDIPN